MTKIAIQGENDGAVISLLQAPYDAIRAVLASDSLWAFNILTATYGSDSNQLIEDIYWFGLPSFPSASHKSLASSGSWPATSPSMPSASNT